MTDLDILVAGTGSGEAVARDAGPPRRQSDKTHLLDKILVQRIVVLDGAMGTMIQDHGLDEADFRGQRFADWHQDIKGNNDLLNLTQPHLIRQIHEDFLVAGADISETNTFNSTAISQADYGMEGLVYELNAEGARLARAAADAAARATPRSPGSSPARLAPPTARLPYHRMSKIQASAMSTSMGWSRPTRRRPAAWSTAASIFC